jgi:hypothetical protein
LCNLQKRAVDLRLMFNLECTLGLISGPRVEVVYNFTHSSIHNSTRSAQFILRKSWVGLQNQLQVILKLIMGQHEIEPTNDFVKLAHCGRHRFMDP